MLALTHRSFAHEAGGVPHNERLEFLGDAVLGLVVTDWLYREHPDLPEGQLSKMRAATVSQRALAAAAREVGLGPYVLLGKGERRTGGADKDSVLCDTVEALIGAVFLSHGLEASREFVHRLVDPRLSQAADLGAALDSKLLLQEYATERSLPAPVYQVEGSGPDHARVFTAAAHLAGVVGQGTGTAKRHAEQAAAGDAYRQLTTGADDPTLAELIGTEGNPDD
ncbi:MAG: ribonuclease III [Promicromonosporaceae bacterium]|nr:ribonuclease III [Promicromonosporaceae bacterium]